MNPYVGISGAVTTGTGVKIGNIKNWSLTVDIANHDITAFGDKDVVSIQGIRNATAQVSGDFAPDAQQTSLIKQSSNNGTLVPVNLSLIVSEEPGKKGKWISTNAQLTNIQQGSEVAGIVSFSASFQLSGGAKYSTT